jgi:hypothetical protein
LAGVVVLLAGCNHAPAPASGAWEPPAQSAPGINDDAPGQADESPSPSPSASPSRSAKPKSSASRKPAPAANTSDTITVFGHSFTVAHGGTGPVGSGGHLLRYKVAVETGLSESPADVAATVDRALDNEARGWLRGGQLTFQRVFAGPAEFVVELATPDTTTFICGKYGLRTGGKVSCRGGANVVLNSLRWEHGTDGSGSDQGGATVYPPAEYRVLMINHEVGHRLGNGHVLCSGDGQPAGVMMTQFFGLHGCVQNIWPYSEDGKLITGARAT